MPVTLRPKYWLRIDVHQAGIVAHKINGIKYLNARLLLLAMLTLTPPAALAEDTALAADEVFLVVVINQQDTRGRLFTAQRRSSVRGGSRSAALALALA